MNDILVFGKVEKVTFPRKKHFAKSFYLDEIENIIYFPLIGSRNHNGLYKYDIKNKTFHLIKPFLKKTTILGSKFNKINKYWIGCDTTNNCLLRICLKTLMTREIPILVNSCFKFKYIVKDVVFDFANKYICYVIVNNIKNNGMVLKINMVTEQTDIIIDNLFNAVSLDIIDNNILVVLTNVILKYDTINKYTTIVEFNFDNTSFYGFLSVFKEDIYIPLRRKSNVFQKCLSRKNNYGFFKINVNTGLSAVIDFIYFFNIKQINKINIGNLFFILTNNMNYFIIADMSF